MEPAYRESLAAIHDAGFVHLAEAAAEVVLGALAEAGIEHGQVVDLGCGSGRLAEVVCRGGHQVLGIDLSPAMIALARKHAPKATFRVDSFITAELPRCAVVTAIGECFNYLFDERNDEDALEQVARRVYDCLEPGGLFLFDVATAGRLGGESRQKKFAETADWAVLVDAEEEGNALTRRITSFYRVNDLFKRDDEIHVLRLLDRDKVQDQLRSIGFTVTPLKAYGQFPMLPGLVAFEARKEGGSRNS